MIDGLLFKKIEKLLLSDFLNPHNMLYFRQAVAMSQGMRRETARARRFPIDTTKH